MLLVAPSATRKLDFPKGHIEKGEPGNRRVTGDPGGGRRGREADWPGRYIGVRFLGMKARVEYFLVQFAREPGPPEEGGQGLVRSRGCARPAELQETRKLLRKAWKQVVETPEVVPPLREIGADCVS